MNKSSLRFRQIHLDFHTSPHIPQVGSQFDKKHWQRVLQGAAVNSVTCFSKCHHGWSYHPTRVGKMHPHLSFDILRAQFDACKEIGIHVPIYISAGVDDLAAYEHPEWRELTWEGRYGGWPAAPLEAGLKTLDFHSPYLNYLCSQIEEAVHLFSECDGVFLDIVSQDRRGCSRWGMDYMLAHGLDPSNETDRKKSAQAALDLYYKCTTEACQSFRPNTPVFHNSGHIKRGDHHVLDFQSHLELESLPTGGWGYDHFPESAKYACNTGKDFLGMTGKFHTTWGEFGGFKHPNALRYECAAMIAYGARCSVGDQLHPNGLLDEATYRIIGEAYKDISMKEPWCIDTVQLADIGVVSNESEHQDQEHPSGAETGTSRVLLEEHFLFTIIDRGMDFSRFRLLVLADDILIDELLEAKIKAYLAGGGKLLLTGESGLRKDGRGFAFDIGAEWSGKSEFSPDYILPKREFRPKFISSPFVMYFASQRIRATSGQSVGTIYDPYFNRDYLHFCGHQHAPAKPEKSGFDCAVFNGNIAYLAHPVFSIYRAYGAVAVRHYIACVIRALLTEPLVEFKDFPSTARVTLSRQEETKRWILHLLFANTVNRGGPIRLSGGTVTANVSIEVIEELLPLRQIQISLRLSGRVTKVTLEPQGSSLPFQIGDGIIHLQVPELTCHQMLAFSEVNLTG
jgi:hypothetical protein